MKITIDQEMGYCINVIKTKKFRTIKLEVAFINRATEKEKLSRELIESILFESSKKYKNREQIMIQTEKNYSQRVSNSHSLSGNNCIFETQTTFIDEKYVEKGHNFRCLDFFFELVFNPDIQNKKFNQKSFNNAFKKVKFRIENIKEDASYYSSNKAYQLASLPVMISKNSLKTLNEIDAYTLAEQYYKMIENDFLEISIIGDVNQELVNHIKNKVGKRNDKSLPPFDVEKKVNFKEKIEKGDYSQSRLVMIYKMKKLTEKERDVVVELYNLILGGGPNSKLFQEVREKKSYCYQIGSSYAKSFQIIIIKTGISKDSYGEVKKIISKQIQSMKKCSFSLKQLNDAKKIILKKLYLRDESPSLIIDRLFSEKYLGVLKVSEILKVVKETTKGDIKDLIKKVELDTIFFLEGENEKNND